MTTTELREEFARGLRVSVEQLNRLAAILQELEQRGEVITGVPGRMLVLLRKIAAGEVLAEVVVQYADQPATLGKVAKLTTTQQRDILDGRRAAPTLPKPAPRSGHRGHGRRDNDDTVFIAAEVATPKDLAGMIAEMISRNPDPAAVWKALCEDETIQGLGKKKRAS